MANFLLIVCQDENERDFSDKNLFKSFLNTISSRFKRYSPEEWVETKEISAGSAAVILRLPYNSYKLQNFSSKKIGKITGLIEKLKDQKNVNAVYISSYLSQVPWLQACASDAADGSDLFRALLLKVLDEMYKHKGISIRDLDITIVHGDDDIYLFEMVRLLSDYVKFVTVISNSKEKIEDTLNGIFSETGLSIGVTKDYKRGLKQADVIINLGNLHEFIVNSRINTKAVILDYGSLNITRVFCENKIIRGLDIELPDVIRKEISDKAEGHFSELQLAEIIIRSSAAALESKADGTGQKESFFRIAASEFDRSGFRIKSLNRTR